MKFLFPYQEWDGVTLPLVPVTIEKVGTLYAVVDSGANISLFQYEVAEILGITVRKGFKIPLSGIGGRIEGYLHTIPLHVAGHIFPCRVCFSRALKAPINLLGRDNFFKQFKVTFDEMKRLTILEKY